MEALFSILFLVLLLASFWHFVVEVLLRPTLIDNECFALYALRDELRRECFTHGSQSQALKESRIFLESSANAVLHNVPFFTLTFLWRFGNGGQKDELHGRDAFRASGTHYWTELLRHARNIALLHSLGWLFYLWPLWLLDRLAGRPLWKHLCRRVEARILQVLMQEYGSLQSGSYSKSRTKVLPNTYSPALWATTC